MDVSSAPRGKEHLNADDDEDRGHGYEAGHGRVALVPKARQTWVGERLEGGGEEVDEGSCDEDACPKVARQEEELVGDADSRKAPDDDGEGASCAMSVVPSTLRLPLNTTTTRPRHTGSAQRQDKEQGEDVDRQVVGPLGALGSALWPSITFHLSSMELGAEQMGGDVGPREA